jgi:hypothetical protein
MHCIPALPRDCAVDAFLSSSQGKGLRIKLDCSPESKPGTQAATPSKHRCVPLKLHELQVKEKRSRTEQRDKYSIFGIGVDRRDELKWRFSSRKRHHSLISKSLREFRKCSNNGEKRSRQSVRRRGSTTGKDSLSSGPA